MVSFLDAVVAFPTAIFTTLLGVVAFYWLLALLGLVDFDSGEADLDVDPAMTYPDLGSLRHHRGLWPAGCASVIVFSLLCCYRGR
jgi:hypothetical protein